MSARSRRFRFGGFEGGSAADAPLPNVRSSHRRRPRNCWGTDEWRGFRNRRIFAKWVDARMGARGRTGRKSGAIVAQVGVCRKGVLAECKLPAFLH